MLTAQKSAKTGPHARSAQLKDAVNVVAKVAVSVANALSAVNVVSAMQIAAPTTLIYLRPLRLHRKRWPTKNWARTRHKKSAHPTKPTANAASADRVTAMAAIAVNAPANPLARTRLARKAWASQTTRLKPLRT